MGGGVETTRSRPDENDPLMVVVRSRGRGWVLEAAHGKCRLRHDYVFVVDDGNVRECRRCGKRQGYMYDSQGGSWTTIRDQVYPMRGPMIVPDPAGGPGATVDG